MLFTAGPHRTDTNILAKHVPKQTFVQKKQMHFLFWQIFLTE